METYEVELEPAAPDGFVATVPALPGLLVFGRSVDEVLDRARAAIAFRVGQSTSRRMRQITVMPRSRTDPYAA